DVNLHDEFTYFKEYNMQSDKFFGHRNYSYDASDNLVTYYPRITNRLYESYEEEDVKDYLELESHYNEYVYEHYTQLTEDVTSFYESHIDQSDFFKQESASYEEAIDLVDEYLEHLLHYEEEVESV